MERLQQALALLGYAEHFEWWHRRNLISAISDFAQLSQDGELEKACEREIGRIHASLSPDQGPLRHK
jgi:hypothetical protein